MVNLYLRGLGTLVGHLGNEVLVGVDRLLPAHEALALLQLQQVLLQILIQKLGLIYHYLVYVLVLLLLGALLTYLGLVCVRRLVGRRSLHQRTVYYLHFVCSLRFWVRFRNVSVSLRATMVYYIRL